VREHKDAWLGSLALVLRGAELERGFLARATLAQNAAATEETWRAAAADERLATLRELRVGRGNLEHYRQFVLSPAAGALATIDVPMPSLMEAILTAGRPPRLTRLYFGRRPTRPLLGRMAAHASLAGLRLLDVPAKRAQLEALFNDLEGSGWLARLTHLRIMPLDDFDARALEPQLARLPPSLAHLTLLERWSGAVRAELRG
jgi:hypothetical protein